MNDYLLNYDKVYEPQEDSFLLLKSALDQIKNNMFLSSKKICEMGVGSGFVIKNIALEYKNNIYFGFDLNSNAIDMTKSVFEQAGLEIVLYESDLFDKSVEKYDMIIFNTPYLPTEDDENIEDLSIKDRALYGGLHGYEVIEKFILQINDNLLNEGLCVIILSSLSDYEHVILTLEHNCFEYEKIDSVNIFFEEIIALKIIKSKLLKNLVDDGINNIKYLAEGKHSKVLEGQIKGKNVIIKYGKEQHILKEIIFNKKLNSEDFVPKYIKSSANYLVREKLNGLMIREWLNFSNKKDTLIVLNKILNICFRLDDLGINKFEMTNPYKHIFIDESLDVKMIDYERCNYSVKPKNVNQVLNYFIKNSKILNDKGIFLDCYKIYDIAKEYKNNREKFCLKDLLKNY